MNTPKRYPFRLKAVSALLMSALVAGCAAPVTRTVWVYEQPASASVQLAGARVGTVAKIEVVETQVGVTGAGAATGAVLGGVLTSPMGHGGPRGGGPGFFPFAVVGIVAGALIGNAVEHQQAQAASSRHYLVSIDFDDDTSQTYEVVALNGLHTGERVQIERGQIQPVSQ
jgi:outer membrane lipoprotein SlyB